jgi:hypothetical protein
MNTILLGVLLVVASVLCAVGIWAFVEAARSARSVRILSDDLDARVMPLLDKADITVDALNAELLRIDTIVSQIEEITDRVESTSRTVQGVANAPGEIVTDIADRVRHAWKRRQAESAARASEREHAAQESPSDHDAHDARATPEPPSGTSDDTVTESSSV